jgi:guanylate kinase
MSGILFIVSAPSGAGKGTILERLLASDGHVAYSVSATTRTPRRGEVDGVDYHFLSDEDFRARVARGEFVEWAEVHERCYGTLRDALTGQLASGRDIILEIDVQGMRQVKSFFPEAVSVFIMAPSFEELERRIRSRGTDSEESILLRLKNARVEMESRNVFDYAIVNGHLDTAVEDMRAIVRAERLRTMRMIG